MTGLLLDTHAFVWWVADDDRLSMTAREAIATEQTVEVSAASLWELAIKAALGKIRLASPAGTWFARHAAANRFDVLGLELGHLAAVEHVPKHHRDPFDRVLVAQARAEGLTLVTADPWVAKYDVGHLW
ncbi:MAG: PIN domain-containing protein [Acidimicrobiia bacterium]|nr:PIN domain-containing protein [Acidimicrobiia bacterium]